MDPQYHAIVIGGGLAGLSAAAAIADGGLKVLLLEQASEVGGLAHAFRRGPYTFDPAIHYTWEAREGEAMDTLFRHLDVRDRVTAIPTGSFFEADFPEFRVRLPTDPLEFIDVVTERFPAEADAIREFLRLCAQMHEEAHELPTQVSLAELDAVAHQFPTLFEYQRTTAADVIDGSIRDPRLRALLGSAWPPLGLPPSQLSFLNLAQYLSVSALGLYFYAGGFQTLVDALAGAIERDGGSIRTEARVVGIDVEGGRVTGVRVEDGPTFTASEVIATGSARPLLLELVGEQHLPAPYIRRLRRMRLSLSAATVFASTKLDLAALDRPHETYVFKHLDHDETYRDILTGHAGVVLVNVPTIVDPSLAPPGEHVVMLTIPIPYDVGEPWPQARDRIVDEAFSLCERAMPGLHAELEIHDIGTPLSLERYTGAEGGAMFGWEFTPDQTASKRLKPRTPIDGLSLAGHWTQPGAGSLRVLASGFIAGQGVLERAGCQTKQLPLAIDSVWRQSAAASTPRPSVG